jgi:hypothetical protein
LTAPRKYFVDILGPIGSPFGVEIAQGHPGFSLNHLVMIADSPGWIGTERRVKVFVLSAFVWRIETTPASKSQSSRSERNISPRRAPLNAANASIG